MSTAKAKAPRKQAKARIVDNSLEDAAARNTLAVSPFLGIRMADLGEGVQAMLSTVTKESANAARHLLSGTKAVVQAIKGHSSYTPDPKDKRYADPAWQTSAIHKRLMQSHATLYQGLTKYIDATTLGPRDKARAQLAASVLLDAVAPSNTLFNPSSLKRAVDTGGASWVKGFKNLVHDIRHNHGLPSSVDGYPYFVIEKL